MAFQENVGLHDGIRYKPYDRAGPGREGFRVAAGGVRVTPPDRAGKSRNFRESVSIDRFGNRHRDATQACDVTGLSIDGFRAGV